MCAFIGISSKFAAVRTTEPSEKQGQGEKQCENLGSGTNDAEPELALISTLERVYPANRRSVFIRASDTVQGRLETAPTGFRAVRLCVG